MRKFFKWFLIFLMVMTVVGFFAENKDSPEIKNTENNKISLTENEIKLIDVLVRNDVEMTFKNGSSILGLNYLTTTANDLRKVYAENEVRGDKTFKGKNIIISGVVDSINSGLGDEPYVVLRSGNSFNQVQLNFSKDSRYIASELGKGQRVKFVCVGNGVVIGSPMLRECETLENAIDKNVEKIKTLINRYVRNGSADNDSIKMIVIASKAMGSVSDNFKECNKIDNDCVNKVMGKLKNYEGDNEYVAELKRLTTQ